MRSLHNPHPGEILKKEFLEEIAMSQTRLAQLIDVPPNRIHAIVSGTRSITADTDLRLCKLFGFVGGLLPKASERIRYARSQAPDPIESGPDQAISFRRRVTA